jgi:hypothetical protein
MLHREIFVGALAAAMALTASSAGAGGREVAVSTVFVPPDYVELVPIRAPLAGAFLVSRPPYCPEETKCLTAYYFQGRFADRPDTFYIVRHHH